MEEEVNQCNCDIEFLLSSPFQKLKLDDKLKYFSLNGPRPNLNLILDLTHYFSSKIYNSYSWLCGCLSKNSLFCWPCLLFARNEALWNCWGFRDIKYLSKYANAHMLTSSHLLSMKDMKKFAKLYRRQQNTINCITKAEKLDIELHNIIVDKERCILKRFIKVIGVLVKLGYVFHTVDSENASSCWNSYSEIMKLVASYDNDLKKYFLIEKKENVMIQYQIILTTLSHCMLQGIKREVSETMFVMLIFDRVIDITSKSYIATTMRYIKKNGELVERFLHFTEWPKLVGSGAALMHILNVLKEFDCHSKLIGYTYDGDMVLPAEHDELKELVKKETRAIFIHYYKHDLSNVLMQVVSTIPAVKIFFASLAVIGNFFLKPAASKGLKSEIKKNSPNATIEMKWEDPIRRLETVFNFRTDIISFLSAIIDKPEEYDADIVTSASGLLVTMRDFDFQFLLLTLQPIFLQSDVLFQIIQNKINDNNLLVSKVTVAQNFLLKLSNQFEKIWWSTVKNIQSTYSLKLNTMCKPNTTPYCFESYKKLHGEIFQIVMQTISERFDNKQKQNYLSLLNQKLFIKHRVKFPPDALARLSDQFPRLFHQDNLRNELVAIYSENEFVRIADLHDYLKLQELDDIFPTVFKFSKFMKTLPLVSKPASVFERIQNFIGSGKMVVDFPLFVIERELLNDFLEQKSFIEQIVDEFAKKAGRLDLVYKELPEDSALSTVLERQGLDSNVCKTLPEFTMKDTEKNLDHSELDPLCDDSMDESSSFLTEESITCIHIPDNGVNFQSSFRNIKQEPEEQPLPETIEKNSVPSKSQFLPPILIKQEIISSEDEL